MAVYLSPGVYTLEKDLSDIVANVSTSTAAIVGYSRKGQVGKPKLITNTQQFINEFGIPNPADGAFHHSALAFLNRGNMLYCVRAVNDATYGGVSVGEKAIAEIDNATIATNGDFADGINTIQGGKTGSPSVFEIYAINPGVWNSDIGITITNVACNGESYSEYDDDATYGENDYVYITDSTTTVYKSLQSGNKGNDPTTAESEYWAVVSLTEDDDISFDISVYYKSTVPVEKWTVSRRHQLDGYGRQMYLEDRINGYSDYIKVVDNAGSAMSENIPPTISEVVENKYVVSYLGKGSDGEATDADFKNAWGLFENPDDIDIRLMIQGGAGGEAVQQEMIKIAESRMDCFAILDTPLLHANDKEKIVKYNLETLNKPSNYAAIYAPWARIHDSYNDLVVEVPPSGLVAASYAYNDYVANVWDAPAGFARGALNVLGLTKVFSQGDRDYLYSNRVNPIQTFRGEGVVIWGQKTLQKKQSALSSVNVRRLLIVIEKAIAASVRAFLFEPNNDITRYRVATMIDEFMADLAARGAFQLEGGDSGYRIVCDSTNNTPIVIDRNELHIDLFVKPVRVAEYIQLQAVITQSGASFDELISKGVHF